jgi:hypothetical protein
MAIKVQPNEAGEHAVAFDLPGMKEYLPAL